MKTLAYVLLLSVWAGAGCVGLETMGLQTKPPAKPAKPAPRAEEPVPPPPPPAVTADQITDKNAAEMVTALREELDCAADHPAATPKALPKK